MLLLAATFHTQAPHILCRNNKFIIYFDDLKLHYTFCNIGAKNLWYQNNKLYVLFENGTLSVLSSIDNFKDFPKKINSVINTSNSNELDSPSSKPILPSVETLTNTIKETPQTIDTIPAVKPIPIPEKPITKADTTISISQKDTIQSVISIPQKKKEVDTIISKPTLEVKAIDYVISVNDLVTFFDNTRKNFSNKVAKWEKHLNFHIEKMNIEYANILQTEKELDEEMKNSINITTKMRELQARLNTQRSIYEESKSAMKQQGTFITVELRNLEKQQIKSIKQQFSQTAAKIQPSVVSPAMSKQSAMIAFSQRIDSLQMLEYLKSTDALLFWYQNVEYSFYQIIESANQRANYIIGKDKDLEERLKSYDKKLKENKKKISETKKERKKLSKQMKANSKELSTQLKQYNKEIQIAFRARMKYVIDEIDYSFKKINEK